MGQKSLRAFIYLAALFIFTLVFPTKIKIQCSSSQEILRLQGYKDGQLAASVCEMYSDEQFYWGSMPWNELKKADTLCFVAAQEQDTVLSGIKIAFGNHLLIENCEYRRDGAKLMISILQERVHRKVYAYQCCYCLIGFFLLWILHKKICYCECILKRFLEKLPDILAGCKPYLYAVMAAILCWAIAGTLLEIMGISLGIHFYEAGCMMWALAIIYCLLRKRTGSNRAALIGSLAVSVPLLVSVERMLVFLTVDEPNAVACMYHFPSGMIYPWANNVCRVSYVVMGTLWKFIPRGISDTSILNSYQLAKIMHWLCGMLLIILIVDFAQNKILQEKQDIDSGKITFQYIILFYAVLLLPVVELGLKNYNNYDMFSMLLGAYGFEWTYIALRDKNLKYGWIGMIMELLAVIEKMNAVILYVAAGAVVVFLYGMLRQKHYIKKLLEGLGKVIGVSLCITLAIHIYVICFLGNDNLRIMPWKQVFTVLAETAVRLVWEIGNILGMEALSGGYTAYTLIFSFLLLIVGMAVLSTLISFADLHFREADQEKAKIIFIIPVLMFLFISIAMVYGIIQSDDDTWKYAIRIMRIVVNAVPTVYLILMMILSVLARKKLDVLLCVILSVGMAGFLAAYIVIRPFDNERYMNMYLCIIVLIFTMLFLQGITDRLYNWQRRAGIALAFAIVLLIDILPSAPAYTFFYPMWNKTILKGEKGIYVYWGEQIAVIGEKIEKYCKDNEINLEDVKIYTGYGGNWLDNIYDIQLVDSAEWVNNIEVCGVTESDFYIFDTQAVMRGMVPQLPQADPAIVVRYKGAVTARVYQGNQLAEYFEHGNGQAG